MVIHCEFINFEFQHGEKFYGCLVESQKAEDFKDLEFLGKHLKGKKNNDVISIQFENCNITKVPQGLTKIFPNLKILDIENSKLQNITKNDLAEYKNFEKFSFCVNDFEFLPGDLFEGFENLEWISFVGNKLKIIEPNILDGLEKLKYVDFTGILNYRKFYSIYPEYVPNATLEEVKIELLRISEENLQEKFEILAPEAKKFKNLTEILRKENNLLKISEEKLKIDLKNEKFKNSNGIFADFKNFIENENFKDFKIKICDREFPVHKFLIAARSPTLAEIIRNNPEVASINFSDENFDISVEIFEKILKFFYTDELPREDETNFLKMFTAAAQLQIKELKKFSASKILDQINSENAVEIFKLSTKYEHDELRQKSFEEIKKKYPKIVFEDELIDDPEKLLQIIEDFVNKEEIM